MRTETTFDLDEARALLANTPALLTAWFRDVPAAWLMSGEGPVVRETP